MRYFLDTLRKDSLFRNSCLFSDFVLFLILCYIAALGTATAAGQVVVSAGILLTAAVFVALCDMTMNRMNHAFETVQA